MPEYLLTGRDATGKSTTERVEAGSADDAVRIAREALGLDDVVLHTDDAGALYSRQKEVAEVFSPRDYLRFRDLPAPVAGFLIVAKALYGLQRRFLLFMLGVLVVRRGLDSYWNWIDWSATFFLLWPAVFAAGTLFFQGLGGRYRKLIDAVAWGRWEEVLDRVKGLEGSGLQPEELAFQKARALAGLGRLDEALAVVAPFGDGATIPEWMYLGRLSDVYAGAKRFDEAGAALQRAVELAPENPTALIDAAIFEVRRRRDPRRARELLERARAHALSDIVEIFAGRLEGRILLEEGRPREAVGLLEDARGRLSAFRHASPLVGASLDTLESELALALAGSGETDAALRHARQAVPRLRALGDDDLIDRLKAALGPAAEG